MIVYWKFITSSPSPSVSLMIVYWKFITSSPSPSLPLEVGPPQIQLAGLGERCEFPSGVWGGAPAEIKFGAFWP